MELLEAAVEFCRERVMWSCNNLLGEALLSQKSKTDYSPRFVTTLYRNSGCSAEDHETEIQKCEQAGQIFRTWITTLQEGWVELLRYKDLPIVFLRGKNGAYDFLLSGTRDRAFDHQVFEPYLRTQDIPKSNDAYHFERYLYFEYNGWDESDRHQARAAVYAERVTSDDDECLREYLISTKQYTPPKATQGPTEGFHAVRVGNQCLYVSNLITIKQFRDFMAANQEYAHYSRLPEAVDRWESVNCEQDDLFPAAVTWYDANAYASWISKTRHLPVRLLFEREYDAIARPVVKPPELNDPDEFLDPDHHRICHFYSPEGLPIKGHPPRMEESRFQALKFCFIGEGENLAWKTSADGLRFLVSNHFGEWLNEHGAAVNSLTLSSLYHLGATPTQMPFAPFSTGKYRSKKVGFRLCYCS